jgi:hypothetical protein
MNILERSDLAPRCVIEATQAQGSEKMAGGVPDLHLQTFDQYEVVWAIMMNRQEVGKVLVGDEAEKDSHFVSPGLCALECIMLIMRLGRCWLETRQRRIVIL